jgi:hypothetical protein
VFGTNTLYGSDAKFQNIQAIISKAVNHVRLAPPPPPPAVTHGGKEVNSRVRLFLLYKVSTVVL